MRQTSILSLIIALLFGFFACTEPTLIGADILEEDQANLDFRNDIPITARTIEGTPVSTYSMFLTRQLEHMLLGRLDDETFGRNDASIYTQLSRGVGRPDGNAIIDSVILSVAYDFSGNYGILSEPLEIEVFRLTEPLDSELDYNSDQTFATETTPIGTASITPNFDSVRVISYTGDEPVTNTEIPQIRIPLDVAFGESFVADTSIYESDTTFRDFIDGLFIQTVAPTMGIVSLRFENAVSQLTLYYRNSEDGTLKEYIHPFGFGQARFNHFGHNYEGSEVAAAIGEENTDWLYMQSMAGLNLELTFPDLSGLEDVVINKAELELTVASEQITDTFPIVEQLIVSGQSSDETVLVADVLRSLANIGGGNIALNSDVFGGVPVEVIEGDNTLIKYRINISGHFQEIVDNETSNSIVISAGNEDVLFYSAIIPKAERANRVILFGENNSALAPKLSLTFTRL